MLKSERPIILVSIKSGDFYSGFLKLAQLTKNTKLINIIKVSPKSDNETKLYRKMESLGGNLNIIRFDGEIARKCFHQLRRKNICIFMNDMEVRVNKRVPVYFLGKECFFQTGVAELAIATNSVLIPVANYRNSDGVDILRIERPIDPIKIEESNIENKLINVTQTLTSDMESWLTEFPEQVHYWDEIADIYYAPKDRVVNDQIIYK